MADVLTLNIDAEFRDLCPALSDEEYRQLEENIVAHGCRDPIVVRKGFDSILDGHNRYAICGDRNIPFSVVPIEVADRAEAKEWIIRNQFGRRNLSAQQRAELALQLKPLLEAKAKANLKQSGGDRKSGLTTLSNPIQTPVNTRKEVAKAAGVSEGTIAKAEKILKGGSDELVAAARGGKLSVNKAAKLAELPHDEQRDIIQDGSIEAMNAMARQKHARDKAAEPVLSVERVRSEINDMRHRINTFKFHFGQVAIDVEANQKRLEQAQELLAEVSFSLFDKTL